MSFLLDALGKAETNRDQGRIPELTTPARKQQSSIQGVLKLALVIGLMLISFVLGIIAHPYLQSNLVAESSTPMAPNASPQHTPQPVVASPVPDDKLPDAAADQTAFELSVISYSENPTVRFVMLNNSVVFEGDELGTGERIIKIEQNGVVIEKDGRQQRIGLNR